MTYLILRLTSLGNVAMTAPVVASLSRRYEKDQFVIVAKKKLDAMFYGLDNVHYHGVAESVGKGLKGLIPLWRELKKYHADVVVDLQDSLFTRCLRDLFFLHGVRAYGIRYGRPEKWNLIRKGHKYAGALKTEFERYEETFRRAGLTMDTEFDALAIHAEARQIVANRFGEKTGRWIGIAPFAKSKSNMLPYRLTKELIQHYSEQTNTQVYLFGAGKVESEMLNQWATIFPNVSCVAGQLQLSEELELMRHLDVMICMDSANQHLASLVKLKTVSIWCGTHTKMGFRAWKQGEDSVVERIDLKCRPCTIHGTNSCLYRNFACRDISVNDIIQRVEDTLDNISNEN